MRYVPSKILQFQITLSFQGSISNPDDGIVIATAIVNTALGTSAAGLCTLIFNKTGIVPGTGGNYSFLITMNGSLTGRQKTYVSSVLVPIFSDFASMLVLFFQVLWHYVLGVMYIQLGQLLS